MGNGVDIDGMVVDTRCPTVNIAPDGVVISEQEDQGRIEEIRSGSRHQRCGGVLGVI